MSVEACYFVSAPCYLSPAVLSSCLLQEVMSLKICSTIVLCDFHNEVTVFFSLVIQTIKFQKFWSIY